MNFVTIALVFLVQLIYIGDTFIVSARAFSIGTRFNVNFYRGKERSILIDKRRRRRRIDYDETVRLLLYKIVVFLFALHSSTRVYSVFYTAFIGRINSIRHPYGFYPNIIIIIYLLPTGNCARAYALSLSVARVADRAFCSCTEWKKKKKMKKIRFSWLGRGRKYGKKKSRTRRRQLYNNVILQRVLLRIRDKNMCLLLVACDVVVVVVTGESEIFFSFLYRRKLVRLIRLTEYRNIQIFSVSKTYSRNDIFFSARFNILRQALKC